MTPRFAAASISAGIGCEGVFVKSATLLRDVAAALGDEGEAVEQDGVVGMFERRLD